VACPVMDHCRSMQTLALQCIYPLQCIACLATPLLATDALPTGWVGGQQDIALSAAHSCTDDKPLHSTALTFTPDTHRLPRPAGCRGLAQPQAQPAGDQRHVAGCLQLLVRVRALPRPHQAVL
jgi:hypothetical protein